MQPDKPQMIIWRMRIAWRICKATVTHLEYVIITASQLQQWLHECASMLRYTSVACLFPFAVHIAVQQHFNPLWSRLLLCDDESLECQALCFRCRCCRHQRDLYRSFLLVRTDFICPAWKALLVAQLPPALLWIIRILQVCSRFLHILAFLFNYCN
jgi:hypothetical protein